MNNMREQETLPKKRLAPFFVTNPPILFRGSAQGHLSESGDLLYSPVKMYLSSDMYSISYF